jgi:PAS domain S-box-containing protein
LTPVEHSDHSALERRLLASLERYRLIVETANEGVWLVDEDGDTLYANARMAELLGEPPGSLPGRPMTEYTQVPEDARRLREAARRGDPIEVQLVRCDGVVIWCHVSTARLDDPLGGGDTSLLMVSDVSERMRARADRDKLQEALQQTRRIETVGQMAGAIAHDFNNLLSVIINYADFALEDLDGHPAAKEISQVRQAAERAAAMTRQLLVLSRQEVVPSARLQVDEVLEEVEPLLLNAMGEHVRLTLSIDGPVRPVKANRGRLEQVLLNLAVNARDAMPDGGRVTVEVGNVTLGESEVRTRPALRPGPHVRLSFVDEGEGMSPEILDRALDPFFTTKPKDRGTGLGLATVFGIVTEAGGDVQLYSQPGQGTTVRIHLPVDELAQEEEPVAGAGPLPPAEGRAVLVVDDDAPVRHLAARILEEHGYQVSMAGSPAAALAMPLGSFDVMLTDIVMPAMSGFELARRVRDRFEELRVVFMSGHTSEPEDLPAGSLFVPKPFSREDLLRAVGARDKA